MANKAILTENQSDVDLTDSFIGRSFKMRLIGLFLITCLNIRQTKNSTSVLDHFPLSLVEAGHDISSRSQLSKEQHTDPKLSPLFRKAVSETDVAQGPICFHIKNGILMRK